MQMRWKRLYLPFFSLYIFNDDLYLRYILFIYLFIYLYLQFTNNADPLGNSCDHIKAMHCAVSDVTGAFCLMLTKSIDINVFTIIYYFQ